MSNNIITKFFVFICIFGYSVLSYGSDNYLKFKDFDNISSEEYIKKALPNLDPKLYEPAIGIFNKFSKIGKTAIQEDNDNPQFNKILFESGYNFPIIPTIQGPFLFSCSHQDTKNILDIGPGCGYDTMMGLLSRKRVISTDIHEKQINILKQVVNSELEKVVDLKGKFFTYKTNFSEDKKIPESWKEGFGVINVNKVFHFLNDIETKRMVKNIYELLKPNGLSFITVSSFIIDSQEYKMYQSQVESNFRAPGLIYFETDIFHNSQVLRRELVEKENPTLKSPGQKIEFFDENKTYRRRQSRHYHTKETLESYLNDYFNILDFHVLNYTKNDIFLSVIAQKK